MPSNVNIGELQWRELGILEKYLGKIRAAERAAEAKYYLLEKKRQKIISTEQRMLERENWEMYFKCVDDSATIVDEQYEVKMKMYKDVERLEIKMEKELAAQQMIFWILENTFLGLVKNKAVL